MSTFSLKQTNLIKIPQRNKDATFGYVKECEQKYQQNQIIPSMIKYLCLIYFNQTQDAFDQENTNTNLQIDDANTVILPSRICINDESTNGLYEKENSYLQNVVSQGIHIWIFKQRNLEYSTDMIGIRNIQHCPLPLTGWFDQCKEDEYRVLGYAYCLAGYKKELQSDGLHWNSVKPWGQECKSGDKIQMTLNFQDLSLHFKLNDTDLGKAFTIQRGSYRAAISLYDDGMGSNPIEIELISYQHIV